MLGLTIPGPAGAGPVPLHSPAIQRQGQDSPAGTPVTRSSPMRCGPPRARDRLGRRDRAARGKPGGAEQAAHLRVRGVRLVPAQPSGQRRAGFRHSHRSLVLTGRRGLACGRSGASAGVGRRHRGRAPPAGPEGEPGARPRCRARCRQPARGTPVRGTDAGAPGQLPAGGPGGACRRAGRGRRASRARKAATRRTSSGLPCGLAHRPSVCLRPSACSSRCWRTRRGCLPRRSRCRRRRPAAECRPWWRRTPRPGTAPRCR